MKKIEIEVFSVDEKLPQIQKNVLVKFADYENSWSIVQLDSLTNKKHWYRLADDKVFDFAEFSHWCELPIEVTK